MKKGSQIHCKLYSHDHYHDINCQIVFNEILDQN